MNSVYSFIYYSILSVLLVVILCSCGSGSIDPQLEPYVQSFMQQGNIRSTAPINASFGDAQGGLGRCYTPSIGIPSIFVDSSSWTNLDDIGKTILMYHELGHCILGLRHDNKLDPDTDSPESIMYFAAESVYLSFKQNPQKYIHQLFNP